MSAMMTNVSAQSRILVAAQALRDRLVPAVEA